MKLNALEILPWNLYLFTANGNSMHTNIDTTYTLHVIGAWLDGIDPPEGFPLEAVKEAIELIMCNTIFEWEELYFLQFLGTAICALAFPLP